MFLVLLSEQVSFSFFSTWLFFIAILLSLCISAAGSGLKQAFAGNWNKKCLLSVCVRARVLDGWFNCVYQGMWLCTSRSSLFTNAELQTKSGWNLDVCCASCLHWCHVGGGQVGWICAVVFPKEKIVFLEPPLILIFFLFVYPFFACSKETIRFFFSCGAQIALGFSYPQTP